MEVAFRSRPRRDVSLKQDGSPEIRDLIQRMHAITLSVADAPVEISDDDSKYDWPYLGEKMAQISSRLEGCSGLQTNLQIYKIELVARLSDLDHAVDRCRERMQPDQGAMGAELRELKRQQRECQAALSIQKAASKAVDDRVVVLRHLESGLHLHGKLFQAKVGVGPATRQDTLYTPERHGISVTGDAYEDA